MEIGRWLGVSPWLSVFSILTLFHICHFNLNQISRVPIFQSASKIWMNNSIFLAAEAALKVTMQLTDWMIDSLSHGSETLVMWLWQVRIPGFTRYTFFAYHAPVSPDSLVWLDLPVSPESPDLLDLLFHLIHLWVEKVKRSWMKQYLEVTICLWQMRFC